MKFFCTPSSVIIWPNLEGDQVVEAYSSVGRTKVVKALVMSGMFRERKHRIICEDRILAREEIAWM